MFGSDSDTVRVVLRNDQTVELDAEEVVAAIDEVADEHDDSARSGESLVVRNGAAIRDEFVIHGDGARDSDLFVVTEDGASSLIQGEELRERAEDAIDEPFEDYLRENVFTSGTYVFEDHGNGAKVAEFDDGAGYMFGECVENAVEDDSVGVYGIRDGWLIVIDER